jgi:D-hexose-6-phosphate mutarotase
MSESVGALDLPPSVRLVTGPGHLPLLKVRGARVGKLDVFLHGAHVTRWTPPGHEHVLWLSGTSRYAADAAIRGGVPICFPWFGAGPADDLKPAHGFARLREWLVVSVVERPEAIEIDLALEDDVVGEAEAAGARGGEAGGSLAATFRITVGESLRMALEVRNVGDRPVTYEEALHTYLAVSDVRNISIEGLAGAGYVDRLGGPELVRQAEDVIRFAAETDRIYLGTDADVVVVDRRKRRRIAVRKTGSASTVVWNPWAGKASEMADLDDWTSMVCVETANVRGDAVTLAPGESHAMTAVIEVSHDA